MITKYIIKEKVAIYTGKYKILRINPNIGCVWSLWYIIKLYDHDKAISTVIHTMISEKKSNYYIFFKTWQDYVKMSLKI